MKSIHVLLLFFLASMLFTCGAAAQYRVPHGVVGSGGGVRTGSNVVYDTAGQGAISGVLAGGSYQVKSGFWHMAALSSAVEVAFATFSCSYRGEEVSLCWSIGKSVPCDGFHVYRAQGEDELFKRLTDAPLDPGTTSYSDPTAVPGRSYRYRIGALAGEGESYSIELSVTLPPRPLTLYQNYPNPFNPSTTVAWFLPQDGPVTIVIYDVSGRRVRTLVDGSFEAGRHTLSWDGRNDRGVEADSGVYYYRLAAGKKVLTRKLVLMR